MVNDLYRPKVFAHGPGDNIAARFVVWPKAALGANRVVIPKGAERRLTVRDGHGVRVADLHSESDAAMQVNLPSGTDTFEINETPIGADKTLLAWTMRAPDTFILPSDGTPVTLAQRGESPVFSALFAQPFGPRAEARFAVPTEEPVYGVTRADAERLRLHSAADFARQERILSGSLLGTVGLASTALWAGETGSHQNATATEKANLSIFLGLGAVGIVDAIVILASPAPIEGLANAFEHLELSSEAERAAAVSENETRFEALAARDHRSRLIAGGIAMGIGPIAIGAETALALTEHTPDYGQLGAIVGFGIADIVLGILNLTVLRTATERMWQQYASQTTNPRGASAVTLAPTLAPTASGPGMQLGVAGHF